MVKLAFVVALGLLLPQIAPAESPAQIALRSAQRRIERAHGNETRASGWVALASAYTKRAREIGDDRLYQRSLEALARALELDPDNVERSKVLAWVRLGLHEFARAEAIARDLIEHRPQDAELWGLLGGALIEQGRSHGAGNAYQRMMELQLGPGAYIRAAHWREHVGDLMGALAFFEQALRALPHREIEDRAWARVQIASLERGLGRGDRAAAHLKRALSPVPDYHYALAAREARTSHDVAGQDPEDLHAGADSAGE